MNATYTRRLAVALSLLAAPLAASAQGRERTPDEALRHAADSVLVRDYCAFAQRLLLAPTVLTALGADSVGARVNATIICEARFSNFSLLALTGKAPAPMDAVARLRANSASPRQTVVLDAMTAFRADVRRAGVREVAASVLGAQASAWADVAEIPNSLLVAEARDQSLRRLSAYERKLGPTSARLNGAEVLLNFAAQRWLPGFRATPTGGPSPLELVASYVPGYITFGDGDATPIPVSASEFGVRYYMFGERFGKSGLVGIFLPTYFTVGVLTASDRNGAMVWPWQGRDRSGAYVSWGSIKVGYVKRDGGSWLLSKQFQAIPFVF